MRRSPREAIEQASLFAAATPAQRESVAALATIESFVAGSTVFLEDDPPGDVYVVLDGRVALGMRVPGRPESSFLSLRSGELLGWSSLLRRRRVATARVVVPTELLRLPAHELLELCERDHDLGYALMRQAFEAIADRLQATRLQLLDVFGAPR